MREREREGEIWHAASVGSLESFVANRDKHGR